MLKRPLTRKLTSWLVVSAGKRGLLRPLISWFAVALGSIVGFVACATFGMTWVPVPDHPAWYLGWFDVAGSLCWRWDFSLRPLSHFGTAGWLESFSLPSCRLQ